MEESASSRRRLRAWVLAVFLGASLAQGAEYSSRELGFRVRMPDGFEDISDRSQVKGGLVTLARFNRMDGRLNRLVSLQDLGGVIRRDNDLTKTRKQPRNVTVEKFEWRDFEVDVFNVTEMENGKTYVTLNAQVPLKPRGIQVTMTAPISEEASMRQELKSLLGSIEGPSNWSNKAERITEGTARVWPGVVALGVLIAGALALIWKVMGGRGTSR